MGGGVSEREKLLMDEERFGALWLAGGGSRMEGRVRNAAMPVDNSRFGGMILHSDGSARPIQRRHATVCVRLMVSKRLFSGRQASRQASRVSVQRQMRGEAGRGEAKRSEAMPRGPTSRGDGIGMAVIQGKTLLGKRDYMWW
jgi:hypothetical protein